MEELYTARATLRDVLRRRGYLLQPSEQSESYGDMCNTVAVSPGALTMVAMHGAARTLLAVVFHLPAEKVGIACMRHYSKALKDAAIGRAILVTQHGLTHSSLKKLAKKRVHLHMEHFTVRALAVNILEHHLVPAHEALVGEERAAFLGRFRAEQLPCILSTDVVVRLLGFRVGDVLRITRPDFAAGAAVMYRRVVDV